MHVTHILQFLRIPLCSTSAHISFLFSPLLIPSINPRTRSERRTMNCSISGEVPEEPVVSKSSGLLFEKRLIERHISDYGKCPITGEPLTMDDIVPVKTGKIVKPRPVQAASIPGMLGMFQIV
ncbi:hypothetical protein CDL12_25796 [Handroanthus impetiginosus]|uniref:Pre-mRNA-processing factor 19 n=1 Tax=Handroanthus impetiginosus TaxID=429701 RepID=A0A2G9G914_9LAMI|nr:hypothetical protein CDL12_25796 [Handroanthus impetiginosus]